jgi:hypothetical protein
MPAIKGRNVRVEIGATYGAAIPVTGVTLANPGVAAAAAHGQLDGVVGYMKNVVGMEELEEQAIRIDAPTTGNFTLQGIDTTQMGVWVSGSFYPVLTWLTVAEARTYATGGGEAEALDITALIHRTRQTDAGLLAAEDFSFDVIPQTTPSPAMILCEQSARKSAKLAIRVTHLIDGAVRVGYGTPSVPSESVDVGAVGSGTLSFNVRGYILRLPA